jgi:hypothetical protein
VDEVDQVDTVDAVDGVAVGAVVGGSGEVGDGVANEAAAALALAREALIAAYPEAVPELIGGATVEELQASVAVARQVYARVVEAARARLVADAVSPAAVTRSRAADLAGLSAGAKIAQALRQRDGVTA